MNKKLIIIGLAILLIIDIGLAYQSYQRGKTPDYDSVTVRKGDIVEIVSVTGKVETASQIDLQFSGTGKITEVKVKTGDKVSAGQVLLSQDSSDLAFQAQSYQAALEIAQAKLAQLLAGSSPEEIILAETAVSNAQKALDDARKSLNDAVAKAENDLNEDYEDAQRTIGTSLLTCYNSLKTNVDTLDSTELEATFSVLDNQALIDAENLRNSADSDYDQAKLAADNSGATNNQQDIDEAAEKTKTALNTASSALSRTYDALLATVISSTLTQTELDTYKSSVSTARSSVDTASTNVITSQQAIASQKIVNQTNINTAEAAVVTAEGALKTAQDKLAIEKAPARQADIDLYQAQVKQAQANLSQIRNQIAQKTLNAPIEGIVTEVAFEKGETVAANQTVVSMNSLAGFEISSYVPESDIAKIKIGNPVAITLDAFGEQEEWWGSVVKIDPAQTVSQGVVYYKITVGLSSQDERIKSGMTANLEIETARHSDALILPSRVIYESDGKKFVKILVDEKIKEIQVETGLKNDDGEIEILSGLEGGESVVTEKK